MKTTTLIFGFDDVVSPDNLETVFSSIKSLPFSFYNKMIASAEFYDCLLGKISFSDFKKQLAANSSIDIDIVEAVFNEVMQRRDLNKEVMNVAGFAKNSGIELILIADSMKMMFDYWIRFFSLRSTFQYLYCSAYIGLLKSEPETWEKLLEVIGRKAEECILIDSDRRSIYAAEKVGYKTVFFTSADILLKHLEKSKVLLM